MTLIEALARAGSTSEKAGRYALIVRAPGGRESTGPLLPADPAAADTVRVDLSQLHSGKPMQEITLRDGDTIFVAPSAPVYVTGQVRSPGAYQISGEITVLQALSLAGGVTDRGTNARLKILRIVNGKKEEFRVKLTDIVQPGDTILVPERYF